jgi:hypothetical protein
MLDIMSIMVYNKRKKLNYFDSPLWDRKSANIPFVGKNQ